MDMNKEYASKGVAGAGLGTGIAGLSLGVLNALGGLAGLAGAVAPRSTAAGTVANDALTAVLAASLMRGNNGCGCGCGCGEGAPVTQRELSLTQKLAEKDTQIALRDADTYTDSKNLEMYKYIDAQLNILRQTLASQAVTNQATADSFNQLAERLNCVKGALEGQIAAEAQARKAADDIIVNYVNATFYPQMIADVTTGTTTTAKQTYNPLPACCCNP